MGTMVGDGSGMGFMAEYLGYEGQTHLGTKSMAGRSAVWMILQLIVEGAGEDKTARDRCCAITLRACVTWARHSEAGSALRARNERRQGARLEEIIIGCRQVRRCAEPEIERRES